MAGEKLSLVVQTGRPGRCLPPAAHRMRRPPKQGRSLTAVHASRSVERLDVVDGQLRHQAARAGRVRAWRQPACSRAGPEAPSLQAPPRRLHGSQPCSLASQRPTSPTHLADAGHGGLGAVHVHLRAWAAHAVRERASPQTVPPLPPSPQPPASGQAGGQAGGRAGGQAGPGLTSRPSSAPSSRIMASPAW